MRLWNAYQKLVSGNVDAVTAVRSGGVAYGAYCLHLKKKKKKKEEEEEEEEEEKKKNKKTKKKPRF
jgi:hypothetical protein